MQVNDLTKKIVIALVIVTTTGWAGCAHGPSPAEEGLAETTPRSTLSEAPLAEEAPPEVAPAEEGPARRPEDRCAALIEGNKVRRAAVVEVVNQGLGRWLQGVQVERVLEKRKFVGWKIEALHLANPCYAAVDLRPGDVVTAVNAQGPRQLERPDSAQQVFEGLKTAPAIEVAYVREGQPRTLRFEIVAEAP